LILIDFIYYHHKQESPEVTARSLPTTSFQCEGKSHLPGYYADTEVGCEVYHYCSEDGRQDSFYCGEGTIFNQKILNCDHPQNVDCASSDAFWAANANIGKDRLIASRNKHKIFRSKT
jgi:hypothetical protein